MGYAVVGGDKIVAGSRQIQGNSTTMGHSGRQCGEIIRGLICDHGAIDCMTFAKPHVAMVRRYDVKQRKFFIQPIAPENIRPLMGFTTIIEMIADELRIRCIEVEESSARADFLEVVPRKSKDIKSAVVQACRDRGWPCPDNHTADALCVGTFVLNKLDPSRAHERTPLFMR